MIHAIRSVKFTQTGVLCAKLQIYLVMGLRVFVVIHSLDITASNRFKVCFDLAKLNAEGKLSKITAIKASRSTVMEL